MPCSCSLWQRGDSYGGRVGISQQWQYDGGNSRGRLHAPLASPWKNSRLYTVCCRSARVCAERHPNRHTYWSNRHGGLHHFPHFPGGQKDRHAAPRHHPGRHRRGNRWGWGCHLSPRRQPKCPCLFSLPFTIFPLVPISNSPDKMEAIANPRWLTVVAYTIGALIAKLEYSYLCVVMSVCFLVCGY